MNNDLEIIDAVRMVTLQSMLKGIPVSDGVIHSATPDICVAGTRVAIELLKTYHIFGRPLKVHTLIYTRHGWEWQKAHPDEHLLDKLAIAETLGPESAQGVEFLRSQGIDSRTRLRFCGHGTDLIDSFSLSDPGYLNGHVVAIMDTDSGHTLLDVTAPQFTTAAFKLFVPPIMVEAPEDWVRDPGSSWVSAEPEELNGGAILYRQPRDLAGMYDAPDWKDAGLAWSLEEVVAHLRGEVNKQLALVNLS